MRKWIVAGVTVTPFLILLVVASYNYIVARYKHKVEVQSELFGTYLADFKNIAKEKLTLNKDGSFIQEVIIKTTPEVTIAKGSWSFNPKNSRVVFNENFMVVTKDGGEFNPDYAHPKPGWIVSLPACKYLNIIQLGSSEGLPFKKISSEENRNP